MQEARAQQIRSDPERDPLPGLADARRYPTRLPWVCFAVWMVATCLGLLVEALFGWGVADMPGRLAAFAAIGLVAAAANAQLARRAIAPLASALHARASGRDCAAAGSNALASFDSAARGLEARLEELDSTHQSVVSLTDAQVADVEHLTESMSSLYTLSEKNGHSIQEICSAVDDSSNAVAELGASGQQLVQTAAELLSRVDTVSGSIRRAAASLAEIAGSTDALAQVASDASSSMDEMAASMREVNENAEHCAELSTQVVGVADQGCKVVQQTVDGMHSIREATETAERVIRGLGDRAGKIGAVVDVIDRVADETSLLALNAAIIAAQAGDHGRGFSVVAGEIRELATRVSASTAEITALIRSVQAESSNAIAAIERGSQSVATGVKLSELAGRSLVEITIVARNNKKRVEGIVHSVGEQTKAVGHVVGSIEEVRSQAERIRLAARDQERGNDLVLEQAQAMKEMAGQVHDTADEQSRGTRLFVESIDSIRMGMDEVAASLKQQTAGCSRVVASTGETYTRAKQTNSAAGGLAAISGRLRASAAAVREIVKGLRY